MNNYILNRIKAFGMTNQMLTEDLELIGRTHNIDLDHTINHSPASESDSVYYPQFNAEIRAEASEMAKQYEIFYALEKSIRALVSEVLQEAEKTEEWWDSIRIPENIKIEVNQRVNKELDAGVTPRSPNEIDYTTFGELSDIIIKNWDIFGALFSSKKALQKIFASLNALRNSIAHCCPMAEDEVLRLQLSVRDWFRLME